MSVAQRAVVVGIGNEWRGDDGAGIAVAHALGKRGCPGARVLAQDGDPAALLDALDGVELALIVDSTRSSAEPGTVRRLDPARDDLAAALPRTSSHALGLADALEIARALRQLPPHVVVYGIEGATFAAGDELSPAVAAAVLEVADAVYAELDGHAGSRDPRRRELVEAEDDGERERVQPE